MKMIVFDQWDKLVTAFRKMAGECATDKAQYVFNAVEATGGHASLADRAVNTIRLAPGETVIHVPEIVPGKARDFILRAKAEGECTLRFVDAEGFEGEEGALMPPSDGETAVYFFTETEPDVLLVARKVVASLEA